MQVAKPILESDSPESVEISELLPDLFTDKTLWKILISEFLEATQNNMVLQYARELEELRWLSIRDTTTGNRQKTLDDGVLLNTAAMLGFNVSYDVLSNIRTKFLAHVSQLPLYHLSNGRGFQATYNDSNDIPIDGSFTSFLSYILGVKVTYKELWANGTDMLSYGRFVTKIPDNNYERTLGIPVTPNTWFKTTHIDLNIDITRLKTTLLNKNRDGRDFDTRVRELFYAYSPINLVINNIHYSYYVKATFGFLASAFKAPYLGYRIGTENVTIVSCVITGPSTMQSNSSGSFYLSLVLSNGSESTINANKWISSSSYLTINNNGQATTSVVTDSIIVTLIAVLGKNTYTKNVTVLKPSSDAIISASIVGPDVINENADQSSNITHTYVVQLTTQSGFTYSAIKSVTWGVIGFLNSYGTKQVNNVSQLLLTINNVESTVYMTLIAEFYDEWNIIHKAQKDIRVLDYKPNNIKLLEIRGDKDTNPLVNLNVDNDYKYECYAVTFANARYRIHPIWLTANSSLNISNQGILSIPIDIPYAFDTKIIATYSQADLYVSADLEIAINPDLIKPLYITIEGKGILDDSFLRENSLYTYRAKIHWSNGLTSYSPAQWSSTLFSISRDSGLLRTGIVTQKANTKILIYARVVFDGLTETDLTYNPILDFDRIPLLNAQAEVTIKSKFDMTDIVSLFIESESVLAVPNTLKLSSFATKNDGQQYPVLCTWKIFDSNTGIQLNHIQINPINDLDKKEYLVEISLKNNSETGTPDYASVLIHPSVEVEASYVIMDESVTPSVIVNTLVSRKLIYVFITDPLYNKTLVSYDIVGPTSLSAHRRHQYTTVITYNDGSIKETTSEWSLVCPEVESDYKVAYVNRGLLTTRTVHGDTQVTLKARYFTLKSEKVITIVDDYSSIIDIITCSYIEGSPTLCIGEMSSYSMMIHWNGDVHPSRESATWSLNDHGNNYAWIDNNGDLTALNTVEATNDLARTQDGTPYVDIVLTAVYSCLATGDILKTYTVRILWCEKDLPIQPNKLTPCADEGAGTLQYVEIYGPSVVDENRFSLSEAYPYILMGFYTRTENGVTKNFSSELKADFWELNSYLDSNITNKGQLTTKEITIDKHVTIKACYTDNLVTMTTYCDTMDVLIKNKSEITDISVEILGTTFMYENSSELFSLRLTRSDGTTRILSENVIWAILSPTSVSYLTTTQTNSKLTLSCGTLPSGISDKIVSMKADYFTLDGRNLSDTHEVKINKQQTLLRTVWGYGDFGGMDDAFVKANLTTPFPETSGHSFAVLSSINKYIYFCHPKSLGLATFYFSDSSGSIMEGGMNGATWPDNEIGFDYSPLTITRSPDGGVTQTEWYLYRSDFANHGNFTIKVDYTNS